MFDTMIIVSACLAGTGCTYEGKDNLCPRIRRLVESGEAVGVCPEELGGLPTPREMSEIQGGAGADVLDGRAQVFTRSGKDVTRSYLAGARAALRCARKHAVKTAVLKSGSPSCGSGSLYDGTFSGKRRTGYGVAAELLRRNGIAVMSEKEYLLRRRRKSSITKISRLRQKPRWDPAKAEAGAGQ